MLDLLLDALPVLVVLALLGSGRASALHAGLAGLAVAVVLALLAGRAPAWLLDQSLRGSWLAWHAIAVIAAGMVFHQAVQARDEGRSTGEPVVAASSGQRRGAVFSACFVLGTFMESVTGFGVGAIIALGVLLRLGVPAVEAAAMSLFTQVLVPWGALAVGTRIGAEIVGVPLVALGEMSAVLLAFVLPPLLLPFWWLLGRAGLRSTVADRLGDLARIAILIALVWLCSRHVGVELGGALPAGMMLVGQWWWQQRAERGSARYGRAIGQHWPYVLLVAGLLGTRLLPGVKDVANSAAVLDPFNGFAPMVLASHPASWLMLVALSVMFVTSSSRPALRGGLSAATTPMLATLAYVVLAQLFAGSGAATSLGTAWTAFAGELAPFAAPALGVFAGALTGSNTASNALMLPVHTGLAEASGLSLLLLAGINNVGGSICTVLTPARIVMVSRVANCLDAQRRVYLAAAPIGVVVVVALLVALIVLR